MTKEEWKQAEEALTHFFHPVELKVDGYDITLILERVSVYQNKIMVYIGGEFRGQWMAEDCEVRRRFLQEQRHNILSEREGRVRTAAEAEAEGTAREVPHAIFLLHPAVVILSGAEETLLRQQPKHRTGQGMSRGLRPPALMQLPSRGTVTSPWKCRVRHHKNRRRLSQCETHRSAWGKRAP